MVNVTDDSGEGCQIILVEATPDAVSKARSSIAEHGGMSAADLFKVKETWKAPTSLIKDHKNWQRSKKAKLRLDATILITLAIASHPPSALQVTDPNRVPTTKIFGGGGGDASCGPKRGREDEDQTLKTCKKRSRSDGNDEEDKDPMDTTDTRYAEDAGDDASFVSPDYPIEKGSIEEYAFATEKAGVRLVLVTPKEMDVLLARAAKYGWAVALKVE
ncbi:hypothetical protein IAR50_002818 [Cryptococcus sp. DSM 104548]